MIERRQHAAGRAREEKEVVARNGSKQDPYCHRGLVEAIAKALKCTNYSSPISLTFLRPAPIAKPCNVPRQPCHHQQPTGGAVWYFSAGYPESADCMGGAWLRGGGGPGEEVS